MSGLNIQWMDPKDRRPRTLRIPATLIAAPFAIAAMFFLLGYLAVRIDHQAPERERRLVNLREGNRLLQQDVAHIHSHLDVVRDLDARLERQRDRLRDLAGMAPRPAPGPERIAEGFLGRLFARTTSPSADSLLRVSRGLRMRLDDLVQRMAEEPAAISRIPTIRPVSAQWPVVQDYGVHKDPFTDLNLRHQGISFGLPERNPVWAPGAGAVADVRQEPRWGWVIRIDHGAGLRTIYAHLERPLVAPGDRVVRGQVIALSGASGQTTGPQLFYAVFRDGRDLNPLDFILPDPPPKALDDEGAAAAGS